MSIIQYLENGNLEKKPLAYDLVTELQEDILTGKIKKGTKLTEKKICTEYNVSRTPVREAFRYLSDTGLIENIPNRGAFVVGVSEQDIIDMLELRTVYEEQCVRYAIPRITKDELNELTEVVEFMEFYTMKDDILKMIDINAAFHQIIYNSTHNRMLIHIMTMYQYYERHCNPENYYMDNYLSTVFKEHKAIYNAFIKSDIEAGALAMRQHMENSRHRKVKYNAD